jgi:hypothetical protein
LSLSSEVVNSLHTSINFILFSVVVTSLISHSCDLNCTHLSLLSLMQQSHCCSADHKCEVVKNVQCSQCFKNRKACNSICKMSVKHCVWLTVLLGSDWVQCSSQQITHHCHHHIWKRECSKELVQQQASYIKVIKAHLHVASRHDLRKKLMSMIEIKLLQLEKLHHQTCLFEDMLNSYRAVVHCHFSLIIHALTDVFQNNLSALNTLSSHLLSL